MIDPIVPHSEHLGTVELRIPAKAEWVAVARLAVSAVANRLPFSMEEIEDLKLALAEACTYCIAPQDVNGDAIDIRFETEADELRIMVRDHHVGKREIVGVRVQDERTEGLGIYIIQSLMDAVDYRVDARTGTELIMTKRVSV
jgi:serine/threonine-protein kinase RsbW